MPNSQSFHPTSKSEPCFICGNVSGHCKSTIGDRGDALRYIDDNCAKLQGLEPCPACGCTAKQIGPGTAPHAGRLSCKDCGRFIKWIKRSELPVLKAIESAVGGDSNE